MEKKEQIEIFQAGREILNLKQCMAFTGFSRGFLYKMTSQRTIPHYKKGKLLLFKKSEITEWLLAGKVKTKEEEEAIEQIQKMKLSTAWEKRHENHSEFKEIVSQPNAMQDPSLNLSFEQTSCVTGEI